MKIWSNNMIILIIFVVFYILSFIPFTVKSNWTRLLGNNTALCPTWILIEHVYLGNTIIRNSRVSYVSSMSIWKVLKRNSLGVLLRNNDAFQDAFVSICKLLNLKLHSSNGCKVQLHKLPSSFQTTKCDL